MVILYIYIEKHRELNLKQNSICEFLSIRLFRRLCLFGRELIVYYLRYFQASRLKMYCLI